MQKKRFPGGVWPVMITPFTSDGKVDEKGLAALVDWYIERGCSGLFADSQSGEMFYLSLEERLRVAEIVVEAAAGRVPVVASGNLSFGLDAQIEETKRIAQTGVDAVILITNGFARESESDAVWMKRCYEFLGSIEESIPLGFYECPYPYKRLFSDENLKRCAETDRFYFLKDTCCDSDQIRNRLSILEGSRLELYNANTATLLESLLNGAVGYSGVMANFHPELYAYLCDHFMDEDICYLQDFLTLAALIERQYYPVNAKYHLKEIEGLPLTTYSRRQDSAGLTATDQKEVVMMNELAEKFADHYLRRNAVESKRKDCSD